MLQAQIPIYCVSLGQIRNKGLVKRLLMLRQALKGLLLHNVNFLRDTPNLTKRGHNFCAVNSRVSLKFLHSLFFKEANVSTQILQEICKYDIIRFLGVPKFTTVFNNGDNLVKYIIRKSKLCPLQSGWAHFDSTLLHNTNLSCKCQLWKRAATHTDTHTHTTFRATCYLECCVVRRLERY